jgi:benzoyl-CoA reductase subunit C
MELSQEYIRASSDPHSYARELKAAGKKLLGYFCSYTPEEIIHAAGIHPLRLFGSTEDSGIADRHLQAYCCSLVRGALADGLSGTLSYLDGAVFPHTCDSIQRLSDIWRLNTSFQFFADVVLPVKLTTESSRQYLADVLIKFKADLEKGFSITITDDSLRASIRTYNKIRSFMKILYEMHSKNPGLISSADLNRVMRASVILDREQAAHMLSELIDKLKAKATDPEAVGARKRIMLVGSVCDQPDIYSLLDRCRADVVWDDLCTGSRYFEGVISVDGDPITALAQRYFERIICPAKHSSITIRGENLVRYVHEHDIHGVIFLLLKFCDPHSFDYPYLKEYLDKEGVPNMLLEIENQLPPEGQLLTRFDTFVQML